jgi:hypothetical protein
VDGRLKGLENIYLQRLEAPNQKKNIAKLKKHKKNHKFRQMNDKLLDDPDFFNDLSDGSDKDDLAEMIEENYAKM